MKTDRMKVGLIISCSWDPKAVSWPYAGYDYEARAKVVTESLRASLQDVEFIESRVKNAAEAEEAIKATKDKVVGYLVYLIGTSFTGSVDAITHSGLPVILVDDLYKGTAEFIACFSKAQEDNMPVIGVVSSNAYDVFDKVKLLEVIHKMKNSRILALNEISKIYETKTARRKKPLASVEDLNRTFGVDIVPLTAKDFVEKYYATVRDEEAAKWREKWMVEAAGIIEPSKEDILESARYFLAVKKATEDFNADAVTVDCSLSQSQEIVGYPCFTVFQLNNDGFSVGCSLDINSTVGLLLMRYLTGRAGFINDPVIDTAAGQIIYAHCTCCNKVFGEEGPSSPYVIRSHGDSRLGAALEVLLPLGEPVTTLRIGVKSKAIVIHRGIAVANSKGNPELGCRTKLTCAAKAKNIISNWDYARFGWHRLTVYGDWKDEITDLATLLGMEVIEEDRD